VKIIIPLWNRLRVDILRLAGNVKNWSRNIA